jgi:hypothetical protein
LADQARPFYDWVLKQFQEELKDEKGLDQLIHGASDQELRAAIARCYAPKDPKGVPILTDGVGRTYPHAKACYYFFAWLIRDAPQQRLGPLIGRICKETGKPRLAVEIVVLSALIVKYRKNVGSFQWESLREVIIDRLEGSRRSIKGHEKESIGRTALVTAVQAYFLKHRNYGIYTKVDIPDSQVTVHNETFDVSANLLDEKGRQRSRILMPIKTRETEGGGHAHLFTRDVFGALNAVKENGTPDFLVVVIVAKNWSSREADNIRDAVDHAAVFDLSPNEFAEFSEEEQAGLNSFVADVLDGKVKPKVTQ